MIFEKGLPSGNMRPTGNEAIEGYIPSRAEEKKVGGLGPQREKKTIHRKIKKSKYLVNKCLLDPTQTMGHREEF